MCRVLTWIVIGTMVYGCSSADKTSSESDGWRSLFDGKSLEGWRTAHADRVTGGWTVEDGAIKRIESSEMKIYGDLISQESFGDFELEWEWKVGPGGNSGVIYRVDPSVPETYKSGPEYQLLDNAKHKDGGNPLTSAGSNYALHAPVRDVTRPVGQWNHSRIVMDGNHVEHWLNATKLLEYELHSDDWNRRVAASKFAAWPTYGTADRGHIVLQDLFDPVWIRAIRVRRLEQSATGSRTK